jgi:hypothetical protein
VKLYSSVYLGDCWDDSFGQNKAACFLIFTYSSFMITFQSVLDMKFSQQCLWSALSSVLWGHVVHRSSLTVCRNVGELLPDYMHHFPQDSNSFFCLIRRCYLYPPQFELAPLDVGTLNFVCWKGFEKMQVLMNWRSIWNVSMATMRMIGVYSVVCLCLLTWGKNRNPSCIKWSNKM